MELYKNRSFGELFQDTFAFLKKEGKHFFKQYFIINGVFLLMLSVMGYFFSQFYTEFFKSSFGNGGSSSSLETYIDNHLSTFILVVMLFVTVAIISGIVAYAFPPIYFQKYLEKGSGNFDTKDLIKGYQQNLGKLIMFIITGIVVAILLAIPVAAVFFLLFITIVGIILLPIIFGGIALFYTMALMEYLQGKRGIWDSFGYSWTLLKSNFIASVSCVGLFYLMSYTIQQVLTLIPYFLGMFSIFTSTSQGQQLDPGDTASTFMLIILAVFFVSFIVGSILGTIVQVNQGIVFYSLKEKNENIQTKSIIDQIGEGE